MWCQRHKRSTGRVGIDRRPLPACINDSDYFWWKLSLSLLVPPKNCCCFLSISFFLSVVTFSSHCVNTAIWFHPADPCFGAQSFIFLFEKVRTGLSKKQQHGLVTGCKSNTNLLCDFSLSGMCFLPTKLMHRLLLVTAGEGSSSKNPRNSSFFFTSCYIFPVKLKLWQFKEHL